VEFRRKLLLAVALALLVHCPSNRDSGSGPFLFKLLEISLSASHSTYSISFSDLGDGTVRVTTNYNGNTYYTYLKKCMQGQTFRSAQNDCRGAGTSGNNWNAQTFQYCATQDYACQNPATAAGSADTALSPAANSCATDTLLSRSWTVANLINWYYYTKTLLPYYPDLPTGSSNQFWTPYNVSLTTASTYYVNSNLTIADANQTKDSSLFVLCRSP